MLHQDAPPRARRQEQPHGQPPVKTINVGGGVTFSAHHQTQCHSERRCLHTLLRTRHDDSKHHGHLVGMATAHRTASTGATRRPMKPPATSQRTAPPPRMSPAHRYATPRYSLIAAFPRTASAHVPAPSRLGSADSPTVTSAQGPRKLSRMTQAPFGKRSSASAFRFPPCTLACLQAPSAPQGAPRERARTRGGRQSWERASTRGRTRQSART